MERQARSRWNPHSARMSEGLGEKGLTTMVEPGSQVRGTILAAILGAIGGGLVVALATRAIPRMASQMMARMMREMMSQMGAEGCDPAQI
jgi:hypothetical protein